jgi:hypothetical protein
MDAYVERLIDLDEYVRIKACKGLGKMGEKAARFVPQLKKTLQDKDLSVRVWAARALYAIDQSTAPSLVDVLTEGLTHSSNDVRAYAIAGLQELGPIARPAMPALRRALQDEWSDVRWRWRWRYGQPKISDSGNEQFESWRERDHDDLVLAVALAVWAAEQGLAYQGLRRATPPPRLAAVRR